MNLQKSSSISSDIVTGHNATTPRDLVSEKGAQWLSMYLDVVEVARQMINICQALVHY